ncbi:M28 family peptidase [Edaphobacillus lindanitolerans]|uniref:Aminopeptidase YwaD n=1 Tax=Edaphobacillus lindanitolerans TaxID=550447 RepID=A0A1U7PP02_9BACI|nr:M28 family peptidase [Edaphobacillus lindanitolerans]SIT80022.1 aminopeptidase YwaD [Edaphobacillus lindanitolerans]
MKTIRGLAVSAVIAIGLTGPANPVSVSAAGKPAVEVSTDHIYRHIKELSKEPRVAGTDAEKRAARYVRNAFKSYGYRVEVQPFFFTAYKEPEEVGIDVEGLDELAAGGFTYGINGDVSGLLADAGLGRKSDLKGGFVKGKIAVIRRGEIPFGEKIDNAARAGASGAIVFNDEPGVLSATLGETGGGRIPAISVDRAAGESILDLIKQKPDTKARIYIRGSEIKKEESQNIIAVKEPDAKKKSGREIVVISSHLDSVAGAPGANDNASGTAVLMEIARALRDFPSGSEVRFAVFGAEELGLVGSGNYVSLLPEAEKGRISANFNLDMVGSRDAGDLTIQTVDGKPNTVSDVARSVGGKLNDRKTPLVQGDRSDHVPFHEAGIPAALFIHSPAEPWYHTADDDLEKISKEKLRDVARIVSGAVVELIRTGKS